MADSAPFLAGELGAFEHDHAHHPDPGLAVRLPNCATCRLLDTLDAYAQLLADGIKAFRWTREYVGEDTLPAIVGWSWFDWCEKARAALGS